MTDTPSRCGTPPPLGASPAPRRCGARRRTGRRGATLPGPRQRTRGCRRFRGTGSSGRRTAMPWTELVADTGSTAITGASGRRAAWRARSATVSRCSTAASPARPMSGSGSRTGRATTVWGGARLRPCEAIGASRSTSTPPESFRFELFGLTVPPIRPGLPTPISMRAHGYASQYWRFR